MTFPASSLRPDAYDAWLAHAWPAAACTSPVLLRGTAIRVDPATGWHTLGDALPANTAADQARKRHDAGRDEFFSGTFTEPGSHAA